MVYRVENTGVVIEWSVKMSQVLVFWENPPSSSIVHKSKIIGGVAIGASRLVVWGKEQLRAKIIRVGEQKHCAVKFGPVVVVYFVWLNLEVLCLHRAPIHFKC